MLASSTLQTIVWTSRIPEAEKFYGEVLGLRFKARSHDALVYDVGGSDLRIWSVPSTQPSAHSVLGFAVLDVRTAVESLTERGIRFERIAGFSHDSIGILTTPDGSRVAWFRDPDGNLLSIVQYA